MPEPSFSRVCPSCGRRVPRNVATCRCGAELPMAEAGHSGPTDAVEEAPGRSPLLVILVVVLALGVPAYWIYMRPAPPPDAAVVHEPNNPGEGAPSQAPTASPEARAWDAAANAPAKTASIDAAAPVTAPAAAVTPPGSSASIEDMVDRVMPAVVLVETTGGRGSGFFVRHDTLITNVHVVKEDGYVTLRKHDGSTVNARVETRAPAFDIAILKIAQPSPSQPVIAMGTAHALKPGQEIVVIGSALGTLQNTVSRGIVSALRTSGGATLVQTDAATNPGNSGGPMLDRNGAAIGITTMGYRNAEGLNFGVAIDHARDLLEGRQVNLGTQAGLSNIQSNTRGSESDRRQQQGEEQFKQSVRALAQSSAQIDAGWQRFRSQCYTSPMPGNYDREWFAVLVPRASPGDAAAGCISYYQSLEGNIKQFQGMMQRVTGDARRANVLPGTIRDTLRTNRLDFDWEK
jgi:S1-C subfamily serine protease